MKKQQTDSASADSPTNERPCYRNTGTVLFWVICMLPVQIYAAVGSWSGRLSAQNGFESPMSIPLFVEQRELVTVSAAGQIKLGESPWSGPEGSSYYGFDSNGDMPPYGYTQGIVMLKINNNWFPIEGGARTFESPHSGPISLYVNDGKSTDNQGSFQVSVTIDPAIIGDADEDGLADELEDDLLEFYAPILKFDEEEGYVPSDVYRYLRNSDLLVSGEEDSRKILDRKQAPYYPEWFLYQLSDGGLSTNFLDNPALVLTYCNIRNSHRSGLIYNSWITPNNTGVYGHVVPTGNLISIQYWIFFGYNEAAQLADIGDHESDWELFEVLVKKENPKALSSRQSVAWYGHGKRLATWSPQELYQPGKDVNVTELKAPEPMQQHASVYIEAGTHGFWHTFVDYPYVGKNRGNGRSFVPNNITNLGEAYRPRLGTEVITQFNGRWGAYRRINACPPGPVIDEHDWMWRAPSSPHSEAVYVGQWSVMGLSDVQRGRISHPWNSVQDAVSAAKDGQTILLFPGQYAGSVIITKKLILQAPHGNVNIGN